MRKAKIVATIGPATESPEMLEKMILAGVNVCRLNFSFGTHEEHSFRIRNIREISARLGMPVAILLDLQGPKIRMGQLTEPASVESGQTIWLSGQPEQTQKDVFPTTYPAIASDCEPGKMILIADGKITLKVKSADPVKNLVECEVIFGGDILTGKGINLPYTNISLPSVTEKDKEDALFGATAGVDFIGQSFVRCAKDVTGLKKLLKESGYDTPVIAKIEKPEALDNIETILDVVDGIMVARGDLAVELSYAKVPAAQKMLLHHANRKGRLTITATEMLSSMIKSSTPTRADVSDVANAIWDGTDAVMLSNESAVGDYPVQAVKVMSAIVSETESARGVFRHDLPVIENLDLPKSVATANDAICQAAAFISRADSNRRIVVYSKTGTSVSLLSKYRPETPILAITNDLKLFNKLAFYHNVLPIFNGTDYVVTSMHLPGILIERGLAQHGDEIICMTRSPHVEGQPTVVGMTIIRV